MPHRTEADLASIAAALEAEGLMLRGGFVFLPADSPPPGPSGRPARAVVLVGNAGGSIWPRFEAWRAAQEADAADPLDTWSRRSSVWSLNGAAPGRFRRRTGPTCRSSSGPCAPKALGILMHPAYGLWHAYRGALLFDEVPAGMGQAQDRAQVHLCDLCDGKYCLKSCPVSAHAPSGFAYGACRDHIRSAQGRACMEKGCLDRNACPEGAAYRYPAVMQAFHMAAFRG